MERKTERERETQKMYKTERQKRKIQKIMLLRQLGAGKLHGDEEEEMAVEELK